MHKPALTAAEVTLGGRRIPFLPPKILPMAVPYRKTSPSRRNMRRSHHALRLELLRRGQGEPGETAASRTTSILKTGMYKGRQVLDAKED
jgi:large subunit ribosomal protein L32